MRKILLTEKEHRLLVMKLDPATTQNDFNAKDVAVLDAAIEKINKAEHNDGQDEAGEAR